MGRDGGGLGCWLVLAISAVEDSSGPWATVAGEAGGEGEGSWWEGEGGRMYKWTAQVDSLGYSSP